ncbi:MAG: hypothetical protein KJ000_35540, partial [Pirellulaceae bacterium]|nr:hypothetical protein [Pirellulaceae bacterium]
MTQQKTKRPTNRRNRSKPSAERLVRQHRFEQLETRNLLAANIFEAFDGYAGAGFQPGGGDGRLDSNVWSAAMGGTSVGFGGTATSGAVALGLASGSVTSGGLYAFDQDGDTGTTNDRLLLIQPTGSVFNSATNGHITLRVLNDGTAANTVSVSYDVFVRNDQVRANDLLFSYSTDGVNFTAVPSATYSSPGASDVLGLVSAGSIQALSGAGIAVGPNDYLYLRWTGLDVSGSGTRDEFGIDNVSVNLTAAAGVSTTTTLALVDPLNARFGEPVSFQGAIVAASGDGQIAGIVQIRDGGPSGTLLASTSDIAGEEGSAAFSFTSTTLPVGTYSNIQAFFLPVAGFEASNSAVFGSTLTVTSDPPALDLNRGLTLNPGQKVVLDAAVLSASDPDAGQTLTYTITQVPVSGVLAKNGVPMTVGDSFTQTDLELDLVGGTSGQGLLTFTSTGTAPASDSLKFVLGDGFNSLPEATLAIEIVAPPAPISFTGTPYTQNFDGLLPTPVPGDRLTLPAAMALPAGWLAAETGANANSSVRIASDGIITSGDTGMFGAIGSNERALGAFASGSLVSVFGAVLVNDTGTTLNQFTLKYTGEQWKDGRSAAAVSNTLSFGYALGAASLADGSFTNVPQLDFVAPTGGENPQVGTDVPLNGNDPVNQVLVGGVDGFTVTGIAWAPGQTLWLRWSDFNDAGNDDALAIDDLVFSAAADATPGLSVVEPGGSTNVTEGGATDTIQLTLTGTPSQPVTVTLTPSNSQIDLGAGAGAPVVLTFTTTNANTPQTVTVTAIDDAAIEGEHTAVISISTASDDSAFAGLSAPQVTVHITDNDFNLVLLNEIYLNPPDADDSREYVELISPGGGSVPLTGLWLLEIEGDDSGGVVDMAVDLSGYSTGANGLALIGTGYGTAEHPWDDKVDPQTTLIDLLRSPPTMENGTITFLLVAGFTGSVGDDLDTNNDGSFNVTPWVALLDSVGWSDGEAGDLVYSAAALSQSTGTPDAATRFPGNQTPHSAAAWYNGDIAGTGFDVLYNTSSASANLPAGAQITPGAPNFAPPAVPILSIAAADADKAEGNAGTRSFTFSVTRSGETSGTTAVQYAVTGSGPNAADASDFGGTLPTGTITFADGETSQVIAIQVSGDTALEPDEEFAVTLSDATAPATIATAVATGTIRNDDSIALSIAAADADKSEGHAGATLFTFTITRSGDNSGAVAVGYAVIGTGVDPADAADFAGGVLPNGTIDFAAGQTARTLTIQVAGDTDSEPDETFLVTLSDPTGGATIATATATGVIRNDDFATLIVTGLTPMESGFHVDFNRAFDPDVLNLYDSSAGALGASDLVVVGASVGAVRGSVVVRADHQRLTFIKTGGPLEPDNYTVTLRSAADGVKDSAGNLLDGDANGTNGGDYAGSFIVAARPTDEVVLSLPDFARGFGQAVNLPNESSAGIPITLSTGQNVTGVDFDLVFDPALLNVTEFVGTAAGSSSAYNLIAPGRMRVTISSASEFSGTPGPIELGRFVASVPETAPYASKQILRLENVNVEDNEPTTRASRADHGLHIAAFVGDANATRTYSSADTTLVQRLIVGQGTGFTAFQLADPQLIADVNRSNTLTSADATLIQRLIVGTPITQAPPIPDGVTPPAPGGPDPRLFIPTDLTAEPGATVTIPVMLEVTEPSGISVSGMDLAIMYDPAVMTVGSFQVGALLGTGFALTTNAANPGIIRATFSKATGPSLVFGQTGVVFQFEATILAGVPNGASRINLMTNSEGTFTAITNNDLDELVLVPAPTNSDSDPVDGVITIGSLGGTELSIAVTDAVKPEGNSGSTPFTFTVTRSGDTSGETTVAFAVTGSGANPADGGDFVSGVLPSGSVTFAAGETAKAITVNVGGDTEVEPDETFTVTLSNPTGGATITNAAAEGTILNDDVLFATDLWINEVLIDVPGSDTGYEYIELRGTPDGVIPAGVYFLSIEGDSGGTQGYVDHVFDLGGMTFGSNGFLVLLQAGHPYTPDPNSSVVVATGSGWGTSFSSRTNDLENGSNSFLLISSATPPVANQDVDSAKNGTLDGAALNWTILDSVGILDGGISDTAYGAVNFSNNGSGVSAMGPVVNLALSNGGLGFTPDLVARYGDTTGSTAADWVGSDVTGTSPIWTLDATRIVPVALTGQLNHLGATNLFTLQTRLSIEATDAVKDEGNSGTTPFTFTVNRVGDTTGETTVEWAVTGNGESQADAEDFGGALPTGTILFAAGETAKTITIPVSGDTIVESDEGFTVTLSNASGAAIITTAAANGIILNDDGITLSIAADDAVKLEGNSGGTAFTFLVTRSGDTSSTTTIDYTVSGSGLNPADAADFGGTLPSGTVTFAAGETSQVITINVSGDTDVEPDEGFTVTLSNPLAPATIVTGAADGTILNDDAEIATGLFISEIFFNPPGTDAPHEYVEIRGAANYVIPAGVYLLGIEGDPAGAALAGDVQTIFNLSGLQIGSNGFLVIRQSGNGYTVDGSATVVTGSGAGFTGTGFSADSGTDIENASVTFMLIQSSVAPTTSVDIDTNNDGTPDAAVYASWTILDSIAIVDHADDIAYSNVVFSTVPAFIGSAGKDIVLTSAAANLVARLGVSIGNTSADWVAGDVVGTGPNFALSPTVAYPANLAGARLNHIGAANNFVPAGLVIVETGGSTAVTEGGATDTYSIALNSQPLGNVIVTVTPNAQLDLGAGAGMAISLTFTQANWNVPQLVTVTAVDDAIAEGPHSGSITHSIAAGSAADYLGLNLSGSDISVAVTDNDVIELAISATSASKVEGNSGTTDFSFTVTRSGDTSGTTTVDYSVTGSGTNSANADDFGGAFPSGTVTFGPGESSKSIVIPVSGDTDVESNETFAVTLSNPSGLATISTVAADGTILNDDVVLVTPTITASPLSKVYDRSAIIITATADDGPGGFDPDINQASFTFTYYAGPNKTGGTLPSAPTNAGSYSVDVAYAGNADYAPVASTLFDFTIVPKELTADATAANKVYDGNTDAVVTISLTGVVLGDTVTGSATGAFDTKHVGIGKPVTVGAVTLAGADAGN